MQKGGLDAHRARNKDGWQLDSGKGSHVVARKAGHMLTVPTAKREIPIGTYRNIAKGAGWM